MLFLQYILLKLLIEENIFKMTVTFLEYIKPVHFFSKIFGISFYSLHETESFINLAEIFNVIAGLPVICLYTYCSWQGLSDIEKIIPIDKHVAHNSMKILIYVSILDFLVICCYNVIYRNKLKATMHLINEHVHISDDKKRYILILKTALLLSAFTVLLFKDKRKHLTNYIYYHIIIKIGSFLNFFDIFTYVTCIAEIKNEFSNIHQSLLQFKSATGNNTIILGNGSKIKDQYRFVRIIQLIENHQRLSEVAQNVCDAWGIKVLLYIAILFLTMVFGSNPMLRAWKNMNDNFTYESFSWIPIGIIWLSWFFMAITAICYSWSSLLTEVRKTPLILHELWNEHEENNSICLMNTFETISLQMLHERQHFTACGFFALDYTLLHTILAAWATYLLILKQFDDISK